MNRLLIFLLVLSAMLALGGMSLLLGRPSSGLPVRVSQPEASVAYGSELVITYDAAASPSNVLTAVGGLLVLGGLMISAAALGRRLGREASDAQ